MLSNKAKQGRLLYKRAWREKNKDRIKAYMKAYMKNYRKNNREKIEQSNNAYFERYYDMHK